VRISQNPLPRSSNGRTLAGPGGGYPTPATARRAVLLLGLGLALASSSPPVQTATTEPVGAAKPTLPNLRLVHELQTPGPVSTLVWSSDGTKLAAGSLGGRFPPFNIQNPYGKVITIWDSLGHVVRQIQGETAFFVFDSTFAFVSGDTQLVTPPVSASGAFALFDVSTGELVREVPKPRDVGGANVLVASPDQSILAVSFRYTMRQPELGIKEI
jgi:WD40 repeat protein